MRNSGDCIYDYVTRSSERICNPMRCTYNTIHQPKDIILEYASTYLSMYHCIELCEVSQVSDCM